MKILKYILLGILVILVLVAARGYFYSLGIRPQYSGEIELASLDSPVEVFFDDYGIPHIYASSKEDMYRAFGYQHAQERLWQMELLRRLAPGRLSEVFGDVPEVIAADKFFRTLSIHPYSVASANALRAKGDTELLRAAEAYLEGVNAFIETGYTPIEYTLTGLEKSPFVLEDIFDVIGYMSFSFAHAHRIDPWVSTVLSKLDERYVQDLSIAADPNTQLLKNHPNYEAYQALSAQTSQVMESLPVPAWIGSNSWVIGPEKSATGKVLFANDPHIGFSQPAVWYEAHLNTPDHEVYGYFVAGMPFAFLAHNRNMAMGLTMFENDDLDFFVEEVNPDNPNQYRHNGEWKEFQTRTETIKIKGADDLPFEIRSSVHGPVVNQVVDGLDDESPVSMWWVYTHLPNQMLEVAYDFNHSQNIDQARAAAAKIHAAGLNVMYGDAEGNVAWWAAARLPIRPDSANSKMLMPGNGNYDPVGYLPFSENPQAENPYWGYVYTANNQPDSIANTLYPGYYLPEDRARRIVDLIEASEKVDLAKMEAMLTDEYNPVSMELVDEMLAGIAHETPVERDAWIALTEWTGGHGTDQVGPTIYQAFIYQVMRHAMEDEIGKELFKTFTTTTAYKRSIAKLIQNETSIWWDNKSTNELETRDDILTIAFLTAIKDLESKMGSKVNEWNWGKVHTLEHAHQPMSTISSLAPYFNVGPFPASSSVESVNNLGFDMDGDSDYPVTFGPSTRRIVDFSDLNNSRSILPTGNSGNFLSPHYDDQAEMYVRGEFRPMLIDIRTIRELERKLVLNPSY